jgi:hypothetical protein
LIPKLTDFVPLFCHPFIVSLSPFLTAHLPQAVLGGAGDAPVELLPQFLEALNQQLAKVENLSRKKKDKLESAKKYHQVDAVIR